MATTSSEEREHYRRMAGMIIQGDEKKKQRLDITVKQALVAARAQMPDASESTLVAFFASVAVILARVLAAPLQDAAGVAEQVFDNYTLSAAVLLRAYNPDNPEAPTYIPPEQAAADTASRRDQEIDEVLSRGYLLCYDFT